MLLQEISVDGSLKLAICIISLYSLLLYMIDALLVTLLDIVLHWCTNYCFVY